MTNAMETRRWRLQRELMHTDPDTGIDRRVLALLGEQRATSHRVMRPDGTSLSYKRFGDAAETVVFCNGLGGTYRTFADVIVRLLPDIQIIVFDYRGMFESGRPPEDSSLAIGVHAEDLFAVMDDAGVEEACVFGWSMGVQVALEAWRRDRSRIQGLVFASGVEGKLLESLLVVPGSPELTLRLMEVFRDHGTPLTNLLARTCRTPALKRLARSMRLVGRNADITMEHAALLFSADPAIYCRIVEALHEHDAGDVLPTIDVPTLILHGDSDVITPVWKGRELRTRISDSEIWVFAGCTHAVILEFPERVARRVRSFLDRRVFG